jgi:multidrug resistance efflux pump
VTFAGGYFELFLWSLAVFVWRLTVPGSLVNYLAYIVVSVCGVQTLFNFNPLLKLDGYYLLSDWLEIPNLQQRAEGGLKARLRWLLWGADRPSWEPRSRALLCYGVAALVYSWVFLAAMLLAFGQFLWSRFGWPGVAAILVLTTLSLRNLFRGISGGEVTKMFRYRLTRVVAWALALSVAATALSFIEVEDRATGTFRVRPVTRAEVRAAVAGFLRAAYRDEGDRVAAGDLLVTLEVPDLASRLAQKRAEVSEAAARLRLLQAGTRPETLTEQRCRVQRARDWRDLGDQDLKRGRKSLEEELFCLDKQIALCHAELDAAKDAYKRCQELLTRSAISPEECRAAETRQTVCQARLEQAQAQHRARTAKGLHEAEAELARRTNELAEAQAALALLEAGARSEEIEAETSHLARLQEEARFLEQLEGKLVVSSPVGGLVTTSRLREKVGQFVHEGDLICVVEEPGRLDVEITLTEQEAVRVRPGQAVILKARALPFETITARVERVAPTVAAGDGQGQMTVYSALDGSPEELRPGMTGHARVGTGRGSLPAIGLDRVSRYVRTEFWW